MPSRNVRILPIVGGDGNEFRRSSDGVMCGAWRKKPTARDMAREKQAQVNVCRIPQIPLVRVALR